MEDLDWGQGADNWSDDEEVVKIKVTPQNIASSELTALVESNDCLTTRNPSEVIPQNAFTSDSSEFSASGESSACSTTINDNFSYRNKDCKAELLADESCDASICLASEVGHSASSDSVSGAHCVQEIEQLTLEGNISDELASTVGEV